MSVNKQWLLMHADSLSKKLDYVDRLRRHGVTSHASIEDVRKSLGFISETSQAADDCRAVSQASNIVAQSLGSSNIGNTQFPVLTAVYPHELGRADLPSESGEWLGNWMPGKTLLVHGVAMMGQADWIQMAPLVMEAKKYGGFEKVILELPPSLLPLMAGKGLADQLIAKNDPLPPHDYHVSLMNLPSWLGVNLHEPKIEKAYLSPSEPLDAAQAQWVHQHILTPQSAGRQVFAFAVKGRKGVCSDVVSLDQLSPLFSSLATKADFICLHNEAELAGLGLADTFSALSREGAHNLRALPAIFNNAESLSGALHVVKAVNAVISGDTAFLHAAAAAGSKVIGLLPYTPDMRYPSLSAAPQAESGARVQPYAYYPDVTLVQQPKPHDWNPVLKETSRHLSALAL